MFDRWPHPIPAAHGMLQASQECESNDRGNGLGEMCGNENGNIGGSDARMQLALDPLMRVTNATLKAHSSDGEMAGKLMVVVCERARALNGQPLMDKSQARPKSNKGNIALIHSRKQFRTSHTGCRSKQTRY
jgi:hypothetical protein